MFGNRNRLWRQEYGEQIEEDYNDMEAQDESEEDECPESIITLRSLLPLQDASNLKDEDVLKKIRKESGAKISFCEFTGPKAILSVSGIIDMVTTAYRLILLNIKQNMEMEVGSKFANDLEVTLNILMPALLCGNIIGKNGQKVNEMTEKTRCNVVINTDHLPNSTERPMCITGMADNVADCIYEICQVLVELPLSVPGDCIPFRPNPFMVEAPVAFSEGKIYVIQDKKAIPIGEASSLLSNKTIARLLGLNEEDVKKVAEELNLIVPEVQPQSEEEIQMELKIPNDMVGAIIGKGGFKIWEIRTLTGANVKISEVAEEGAKEREITIIGQEEGAKMAKFLIDMLVEYHKISPTEDADPMLLSQLLTLPGAVKGLLSLTDFAHKTDVLGSFADPAFESKPTGTTMIPVGGLEVEEEEEEEGGGGGDWEDEREEDENDVEMATGSDMEDEAPTKMKVWQSGQTPGFNQQWGKPEPWINQSITEQGRPSRSNLSGRDLEGSRLQAPNVLDFHNNGQAFQGQPFFAAAAAATGGSGNPFNRTSPFLVNFNQSARFSGKFQEKGNSRQ